VRTETRKRREILQRAQEWQDRFDRTKKRLEGASVPTLIEALKNQDSAVSWPARHIIEAQPGRSVRAVIRVLKSPSPEARRNGMLALSTMAFTGKARALLPKAVPILVGLLADRHVGFVALMALAAIEPGHPALGPTLLRLARERHPFVSVSGYIWEKIGLVNESVGAALAEACRDPEPAVRDAARKTRRRLADKRRRLATGVPRLLQALDAPRAQSRFRAILTLSEVALYTPSVLPGLIKALKDSDGLNRRIAATVLGRIGCRSTLPALTASLRDEDPDVRAAAADAIEAIRSASPPRKPRSRR